METRAATTLLRRTDPPTSLDARLLVARRLSRRRPPAEPILRRFHDRTQRRARGAAAQWYDVRRLRGDPQGTEEQVRGGPRDRPDPAGPHPVHLDRLSGGL